MHLLKFLIHPADIPNMVDGRKTSLIAQAVNLHKRILPCSGKNTLYDCFTLANDSRLMLWFNLPDGNTKVMMEEKRVA